MSKYIEGKIYKLTSSQTDKVYIGSTITSLDDRFSKHKCHYKSWLKSQMNKITSYDLLQYTDVKIELIKEFPCETKKELEKEEGKLILDNNCVNKHVAGRTKTETDRIYRHKNKERINETARIYWNKNKEKIKERKKKYVEANKEKIKEYYKEYVEANKERLKEYRKEYVEANKEREKEKFTCECGGKYTYKNKSQHFKSKKHLKFVNQV